MKKFYLASFFFLILLSSFSVHKFYVSIYQINFNKEKKYLEITARIFYDDLNTVLSKKHNKKTHIGQAEETENDILLMKNYILDNFFIKVNGKNQNILFLSKENEANLVICYFKISNVSKIKTLTIENTSLFDLNSEQQNIIQTNIYNKKQNLLLTPNNVKGLLNH